MDISIVNVALPAIRRDLHASVSGLQWTVDAYTLVLASFLVLAGSTADRFGRRRIFQIGPRRLRARLAAVRPGAGHRLADRGARAAGRRRHDAQPGGAGDRRHRRSPTRPSGPGPSACSARCPGLSLALGPILGGALVDAFGWRAIFWVNVPIVAAAIVCTALFVPESRAARARRFDPVGQVLVVLVLGSVVYAIIESSRLGWTSPVILGLLAVAVLGARGHPRLRTAPRRPAAGAAPVPQRAVQRGDRDGAVRPCAGSARSCS